MTIFANRFALNDRLCEILAEYGWHDDGSDTEGERLNRLVHEIADRLEAFLNHDPFVVDHDPRRQP